MKKLLLLSLLLFINLIYSQEKDCSKIETELSKKEQQIDKMQKEIEFYKESLSLRSSKISVKQDDFVLKINSVIGKSNNGTIIVKGLVENKGVMRAFRPRTFETFIYDTKGNSYKARKIKFGELNNVQEFQRNLPLKFTITFDKIGEEMPIISNLTAVFNNAIGRKYSKMIFKNLKVDWE